MKTYSQNYLKKFSVLLLAGLGSVAASAQTEPVDTGEGPNEGKADVSVTVLGTAIRPIESIGTSTVSGDSVSALSSSSGDINEIARTRPNVQFTNGEGLMSGYSIQDISPARISISGGRTYSNNFIIDGLSTSSVLDTTNTNYYHYEDIVNHPQTTFVSPSLIESVTIMDSNISAQYGGFTGGVVEATLKDPVPEYHAEINVSYTSDSLAVYKVAPDDKAASMPEKARFTKYIYDFNSTAPIYKDSTSILLGYSLTTASIANSRPYNASFGKDTKQTESQEQIFLAKVKHDFSDSAYVKLTTKYTQYYFEEFAQSEKTQHNDGFLSKLEFQKEWDTLIVNSYAGFQYNDNMREDEPLRYLYRNFGTEATNWVASSSNTASTGGSGDRESGQLDIPVGFSARWQVSDTARLNFGADYKFTKAWNTREEDNFSYGNRSSSKAIDPLAVSADGPDDPTVIEGEQGLDRYNYYRAFDAEVKLNSADAWIEWLHEGKLAGMKWNYRAGLRYETDDFLDNHNLAPRLTAQLKPIDWLTVFAGANRYYNQNMVAYALKEQSPNSYVYYRNYTTNTAGQHVYSSADWYLYLDSATAKYSQADVNTPHADEYSAGATVDAGVLGSFAFKHVYKLIRDEFAVSPGEQKSIYDPFTGTTKTHRTHTITNDGWTDYKSLSLEWTKVINDHKLTINLTKSNTKSGNVDYFEEYDHDYYEESVYYNGRVMTRHEIALVRENYSVPFYVNFIWQTQWFNKRLSTTMVGRWSGAYNYTEYTGSITVDGVKYNLYEDVRKSGQFVVNLDLNYLVYSGAKGDFLINAQIDNLLNRFPHTETSTTNPYQEGTSAWIGVTYKY